MQLITLLINPHAIKSNMALVSVRSWRHREYSMYLETLAQQVVYQLECIYTMHLQSNYIKASSYFTAMQMSILFYLPADGNLPSKYLWTAWPGSRNDLVVGSFGFPRTSRSSWRRLRGSNLAACLVTIMKASRVMVPRGGRGWTSVPPVERSLFW